MPQPVFSRKATTTSSKDRTRGGQDFNASQDSGTHNLLERVLEQIAISNHHLQSITDERVKTGDIDTIKQI
jgi:hypothetical protein